MLKQLHHPNLPIEGGLTLFHNTFTGPSGQLYQSSRSDLVGDVDHGVLGLTTLSSSVHNIPGYFRIKIISTIQPKLILGNKLLFDDHSPKSIFLPGKLDCCRQRAGRGKEVTRGNECS